MGPPPLLKLTLEGLMTPASYLSAIVSMIVPVVLMYQLPKEYSG